MAYNPRRVVVLSGNVGAGKTALARRLEGFGLKRFSTGVWLQTEDRTIPKERRALQKLGAKLDERTGGSWVRDALARQISKMPPDEGNAGVVVDAVRIHEQIEAIRNSYGRLVVHIHLTAPPNVLAGRYLQRTGSGIGELGSYEDVLDDPVEAKVSDLAQYADIIIDSQRCTIDDVVTRAASQLGLYGRNNERLVDVLVGGQYGSEGKGQVAAYLSPEYEVLVRVGGPNAGHKVYRDGKPITFHLLPSGTADSNADLVLGPGTVIDLDTLMEEIARHGVSCSRLSIDPRAVIIGQEDRESEKQLVSSIGSTGRGVGAATSRKILQGRADRSQVRLAEDCDELRPFLRDSCGVYEQAFAKGKRILLEGTQGTALSLHHGYYPYVTSRDTTVAGTLAEAGLSPCRVRNTVMVCRTYPIRVQSPAGGSSGPMSQNTSWEEISRRSGIPVRSLRKSERTSTTNRRRRVAEFDWSLLRKAATLNAPTDIALTFADYLSIKNRDARRFDQLQTDTILFIEEVERVAGSSVSLIATRFHHRSIIDRRHWRTDGNRSE